MKKTYEIAACDFPNQPQLAGRVGGLLATLQRVLAEVPDIAEYELIYESVNPMEETQHFYSIVVDHEARTAELRPYS